MSSEANKADETKVRPFLALWYFTKAAFWFVVAFYLFKYSYFLLTEHPIDFGLEIAAKKTKSAADAIEQFSRQHPR